MRPPNLATPGPPVCRVTDPVTLANIGHAIGAVIVEAVRIPGKVRSSYRAWTTEGACYEMAKSGEQAMQPVRREQFDRALAC